MRPVADLHPELLAAIAALWLLALLPSAARGAPPEPPVDAGPMQNGNALFADRQLFASDELIVAFRPGIGAAASAAMRAGEPSAEPAAAGLDALLEGVGAVSAERVYRSLEDDDGNLLASARDRATATAQRFAARAARGPLDATLPDLENAYRVRLAEGSDVLAAVASLASHPGVVYAEPNYFFTTRLTPLPDLPFVPDDRYVTRDGVHWSEGAWGQQFPDLWGIELVEAVAGWNVFDWDGSGAFDGDEVRPGEGVVVAVIDSGLDAEHAEIASNVWRNPGEIADNGIDDDGNGFIDDVAGWDFVDEDGDPGDEHGHGTHVAGTVVAAGNNGIGVIGVAPWASILPVKGLDARGRGSAVDLARAVRYAVDAGADVLSNSWGSIVASQLVSDAFEYARLLGAISLAAAGNSSANVESSTPANLDSVIAVAAIDPDRVRAGFSNFGFGVEVSAPGVDILSLNANGGANFLAEALPDRVVDGDYLRLDGTSMACPHAAGVAAVLLSHRPDEAAHDIRGRLLAGAQPIAAQNPGFERLLGRGSAHLPGSLTAVPRPLLEIVATESSGFSPGSEARIVVRLRNFWRGATDVAAEISTESPSATVHYGRVVLGDVGPGERTSNDADPFLVEIDPAAAFGTAIPFELALTGADGYAETLAFTIAVTFFEDVAARVGLPVFDLLPWRVNLQDYNGDGLADAHWIGFFQNALYKNLGDGTFADASAESGVLVQPVGLAQGLLFDIDNDLDRDLFMAGFNFISASRLFLNGGAGVFSDITETSGVGGFRSFVAAAFDHDDDGLVDFVGGAVPLGGGVSRKEGLFLARNAGDGSFEDVTRDACLDPALDLTNGQIAAVDYDNDGDSDLFAASLAADITLLRNEGDGRFSDVTHAAGFDLFENSEVACRPHGRWRRGRTCEWNRAMGFAVGDYDNDGRIDLFATGRGAVGDAQRNALFRNNGDGTFSDVIAEAGDLALGGVSGLHWGNAFFDYDNDGDLDLYVTNEGVGTITSNTLYRNDGDGTFSRVTEIAFPWDTAPSGAAAAVGDFNDDGALDLYAPSGILGFGGRGAVYENLIGSTGHWIKIDLRGTISHADAFGARVSVTTGGRSQLREVHTGPVETLPLHFGLGDATVVDELRVRWPSGLVETFSDLAVDRRFEIEEASGCTPESGGDPSDPACAAVALLLERRASARAAAAGAATESSCDVQGRPAELPPPGSKAEGPKPKQDPK
jgi:subtilisin family serine protease